MDNIQKLVDEAYEEGKKSYRNGKKRNSNPYNGINKDLQFDAWNEGYYNASQDD